MLRHLIVSLVSLASGALVTQPLWAQAYPVKPIRMVIALAPGGGVDTTSRIIGPMTSCARFSVHNFLRKFKSTLMRTPAARAGRS